MPLLNVVGTTPQNKTFFFCFVFLKYKIEDQYRWALQKITAVLRSRNTKSNFNRSQTGAVEFCGCCFPVRL